MRKHASFALAALAFVSALIFFAIYSMDGTTADTIRPRVGTPHVVPVDSFLPSKNIEPLW